MSAFLPAALDGTVGLARGGDFGGDSTDFGAAGFTAGIAGGGIFALIQGLFGAGRASDFGFFAGAGGGRQRLSILLGRLLVAHEEVIAERGNYVERELP